MSVTIALLDIYSPHNISPATNKLNDLYSVIYCHILFWSPSGLSLQLYYGDKHPTNIWTISYNDARFDDPSMFGGCGYTIGNSQVNDADLTVANLETINVKLPMSWARTSLWLGV